MKATVNIFWFRRDLRLDDNTGLYYCLKEGLPVLPIFIFDFNILDQLENHLDPRVEFIFNTVQDLQRKLISHGSSLEVFYGKPMEVFVSLIDTYEIGKVFTNEDYEPYARERDSDIESLLAAKGIGYRSFKDHVIFSKQEILKDDGLPYTVFTPYSNKWMALLKKPETDFLGSFQVEKYLRNLFQHKGKPLPLLSSMGFSASGCIFPSSHPDPELIGKYNRQRDFPGLDATSHLGIHIRFGTISIRRLASEAEKLSTAFLNELIWRDFYQMILWHFPRTGKGYAFKESYERIPWRNNDKEFAAWCEGKTGYPLVDAGMRQLNQTGFMHNRLRMITASFLAKHLLIDWRWGEAYFSSKLLDFDLASNNGGWQWASGSGCDAVPYFRIFNPALQQKKFDSEGTYINKWVPDLQDISYPKPVVEHTFARSRAIRAYQSVLKKG